jgi:enoyl-CoA hydratase
MSDPVELKIKGSIAIVTINNPPVNSLSKGVHEVLDDIFTSLPNNRDVRVVILTGAGDKAFIAGADLDEIPEMIESPELMASHMAWTRTVFSKIARLTQPVIAAVQSNCVGGGLEVALLCDIIIADERAKFGLPETRLGLIPGGGGTQRILKYLSPAKAKELIMFSSIFSAADAENYGIINRVVPAGEAFAVAMELAQKLSNYPALAVQGVKKAINEGGGMQIEGGLTLEQEIFMKNFVSDDFNEGVKAFMEKRKPVFTHK